MKDKIVLAYSGGLDTSVSIKWIQDNYNVDVITVTLEIGQQVDLESIGKKAEKIGALKHYGIDARDEFARKYAFQALKANALYEGKYPVSSALSRPLIASKIVEVANDEGAIGVAHGCTGKGNDQVRFDITFKSLGPDLQIIAPVREWQLTRDSEIKYASKHKIPVPADLDSPYSTDENLWGRSIECGVLELPDHEPPEEIFEWTVAPEEAPDQPEYVSIAFEEGTPKAVNGKALDPVTLITTLNKMGGKHGVGRIDHMEDRVIGIKSRETYECPGSTMLLEAHADLEKSVLTRHEVLFKQQIDAMWTYLIYAGLWMEPLKTDLDAFINETQKHVTGEVRLKLYKGSARVVGRTSPFTLYDLNLATYEGVSTFDQSHSPGFIELWGLPTRAANVLKQKKLQSKN
jgi:argininosuccinate synthase